MNACMHVLMYACMCMHVRECDCMHTCVAPLFCNRLSFHVLVFVFGRGLFMTEHRTRIRVCLTLHRMSVATVHIVLQLSMHETQHMHDPFKRSTLNVKL